MAESEIIFEVREDGSGYCARARDYNIFTQGETWPDLESMVADAVKCHFADAVDRPSKIKLVRELK